jgi:hypothetical protein
MQKYVDPPQSKKLSTPLLLLSHLQPSSCLINTMSSLQRPAVYIFIHAINMQLISLTNWEFLLNRIEKEVIIVNILTHLGIIKQYKYKFFYF